MTYGVIAEPWWNDQDVFIIGGGLSLKERDIQSLHKKGIVIGVNRAAEFATCHATFTIDHSFIRNCAGLLKQWAEDGQEVYAAVGNTWLDTVAPIPGVTYLLRVQGQGVGDGMSEIVNGCNSGYGALCLAIKKRSRRIWLLGFDMKDKNTHWHDGYKWGCNRSSIYFERWAKRFGEIKNDLPRGVKVFNCNPDSGIVAFPFSTYDHIGI